MNNNELIKQNYFQLFGLEVSFDLNQNQLKDTFRELQKQYHPDKYAGTTSEIQADALIFSSHINQAYLTLMNPLNRALYLLQLRGVIVDLVHETKFSPEFLVQQMQLREDIEDATETGNIDVLEQIAHDLIIKENELALKISGLLINQDIDSVIELVKQLAFYQKLQQVVDNSITQL